MSKVEPKWISAARRYIGTKEVPGPKHNALIGRWLTRLRAWWQDDETPWCGVFVAAMFDEVGIAYPKHWYRAKAWADWGVPVSVRIGAVLVFNRAGGGHVGFYVGETPGHYLVLGGNQGNAVTVSAIARDRLLAARWPAGVAQTHSKFVVTETTARLSTNEA